MKPIESDGRTVSEAVDAALRKSGLRRDQVEVTVIDEGSPGFLGLGAKPACIRLTEKRWGSETPAATLPTPPSPRNHRPSAPARSSTRPATTAPTAQPARPAPSAPPSAPAKTDPPRSSREASPREQRPLSTAETLEACAKAQELVVGLLKLMSVAAPTVTTSWDAEMERVKAVVESQDAPLLVGRDGRILESLQFLTTLMISRAARVPTAVQVDALSYWEKREQAIIDEALRAIERVKATGTPCRLEPMDASMRRLIHRTFASSPAITTSSEGEGPWRKIVIRPRKV